MKTLTIKPRSFALAILLFVLSSVSSWATVLISSFVLAPNGDRQAQCLSDTNYYYVLYKSTNVAAINQPVAVVLGTGSTITLTDTNAPIAAEFYRVGAISTVLEKLVINEIDYDQPGSFDTNEFVEIYNAGTNTAQLSGLALVFINGNNNQEYLRVDLGQAGSLDAGHYLVVGSSNLTVAVGAQRINLPTGTNDIQNGSPDGVILVNTNIYAVLDAFSYEGAITAGIISNFPGTVNLVEGEALSASIADDSVTNAGSLIRYPNGQDSNNATNDWRLTTVPTPGSANTLPSGGGQLVINEIDYDQPGTDDQEFIELYNAGSTPASLVGLSLVFVNGANNLEYLRVDLSSATIPVPPGGYLVVASSNVTVAAGAQVIYFTNLSNVIQNGSPDGVALVNTNTFAILDALAYEGGMTSVTITGFPTTVNLTEGTALNVSVADSNITVGSLIRYPNGQDTDNANVDWRLTANITPGSANLP